MHPFLLQAAFPLASSVPALAGALVASVWQGLLLTFLVACSLRLLPDLSSAARSAVWCGVLFLVTLSPVLSLALSSPRAAHPALVHVDQTISLVLIALWATASLVRLAQLLASALRLRAILQRATPMEPIDSLRTLLQSGPRPVTLCLSADVDRPSVAGFLRPRILLPPDLLAQLSDLDLAHIVLHEIEHLRRHDDWFNLLQQLSLVLFPLNPALLWLNRRLSLERELACDDGVLRATRARKAYAGCLARVAESSLVRRGVSLALGILGGRLGDWKRRPELTRRVERILATPRPGMGRTQMRFATAILFAGVLGSSAVLAHSPQLVSFTPGLTSGSASSSASDSARSFSQAAEPSSAWSNGIAGMPRPMPVRAVMPAPSSMRGRMVTALAFSPQPAATRVSHRGRLQTALRRRPRPRVHAWTLLTSWRQPSPTQPRLRLVPVVFEDSQTWFTAVAWRDGWIVVQL